MGWAMGLQYLKVTQPGATWLSAHLSPHPGLWVGAGSSQDAAYRVGQTGQTVMQPLTAGPSSKAIPGSSCCLPGPLGLGTRSRHPLDWSCPTGQGSDLEFPLWTLYLPFNHVPSEEVCIHRTPAAPSGELPGVWQGKGLLSARANCCPCL